MSKKYLLIAILFLLALIAWSPWITKEYSEERVQNEFQYEQKDVVDGCGLIKLQKVNKVIFGYSVEIEYACGLRAPTEPTQIKTVFVSPIGSVYGLPTLR